MKPKGKLKALDEIKIIISKYTKIAKRGKVNKGDDIQCYKLIYAIAELFPAYSKDREKNPEVEILLDKAWVLYFFFKENIEGKKTNYINIVNKYSIYEKINTDRTN